jgi:type IV secretion system protein VirB5
MSTLKKHLSVLAFLALLGAFGSAPAKAGIPVIDVANLAQAIEQVISWGQQLEGMAQQYQELLQQYQQLKQTYASLTGPRGMQNLLPISLTTRNYLPANYAQFQAVMTGSSAQYPLQAMQVQSAMQSNAILMPVQVATLSPLAQQLLTKSRQTAATLNMLAQQNQANASNNFSSLQALITALGGTQDTKASLDLSGRIQAEQVMTQSNQIKTEALYRAVQAQAMQNEQTAREAAIQMQGSQATLTSIKW